MKNLKKDLLKRLFPAFLLIGVISSLLYFAYVSFFSIVVVLAIAFFSVVATYEFINICKTKVKFFDKIILIFSPLMVGAFFLSAINGEFFKLPLFLIFLFIILIFLKHFSSVKDSIVDISVSFFALLYISVPLGMLVYILYAIKPPNLMDGRIWVITILILSKISDIFGYFIGKLFGRNKMIEKVSPNKTWEGSISGGVGTIIAAVAIQYFLPYSFNSYIIAVVVGLMTAVLSQIGDLCESLLKRDAKVKDSNKIPGVGGILDSLDSLLFTIPFYYIWIS